MLGYTSTFHTWLNPRNLSRPVWPQLELKAAIPSETPDMWEEATLRLYEFQCMFLRWTITLQLHCGGMAFFHCNTHNDHLVDINNSLLCHKFASYKLPHRTACWWFEQVITNDRIIALQCLCVFSQINNDTIRWCRYFQEKQSCDSISANISCSHCCQQVLIFPLWDDNFDYILISLVVVYMQW